MLSVENLTAGYGVTRVLRDVSIDVQADEIVTILGPNGAGKSTLMKTITGIVRPTTGQITLNGERIDRFATDKIARRGIALVPEGRRMFSLLTVKEALMLAGHAHGDRKAMRDDLEYVFSVFPVLAERASARGDQLSGGQQQMVALGRAIMQRPNVVLMDEPSVGLAPMIVQQLPKMIGEVKERTGACVLLIEQEAGMALAVASRGYVLQSGKIIQTGTAEELSNSEMLIETYLGRSEDAAAR